MAEQQPAKPATPPPQQAAAQQTPPQKPFAGEKPNIKEFMEATGVDFKTAADILYGVVGSNKETRNWNAIMASKDPVATAREATAEMYGGVSKGVYTDPATGKQVEMLLSGTGIPLSPPSARDINFGVGIQPTSNTNLVSGYSTNERFPEAGRQPMRPVSPPTQSPQAMPSSVPAVGSFSPAQKAYADQLATMKGQGSPAEISNYVRGLSDAQALASLNAITGNKQRLPSTMSGYDQAAVLAKQFGVSGPISFGQGVSVNYGNGQVTGRSATDPSVVGGAIAAGRYDPSLSQGLNPDMVQYLKGLPKPQSAPPAPPTMAQLDQMRMQQNMIGSIPSTQAGVRPQQLYTYEDQVQQVPRRVPRNFQSLAQLDELRAQQDQFNAITRF